MDAVSDDARTTFLLAVMREAFADLVAADPAAFRKKFRTMAADPFAFYRGTACVFYADLAEQDDPWADERTARVWIQGDLHAQNFGTYMDGEGRLVFDVNDFDEAYLGHFTWDLKRLVASVALMGWTKALPDSDITDLVQIYVRAYLDQVQQFVDSDRDHEWSLRLVTATGPVRDALLRAQLATRVDLLDGVTVVDDYQRRFAGGPGVRRLDDAERSRVEQAYAAYLETIPQSKRLGSLTYTLKDVVGKSGFGIGSAGLPAYNLLVEGHTEALENDVVLTMKQASVAAPSRVLGAAAAGGAFEHHGHRTALSQRALQAHADPWLGWTELDGVGFVVAEYSPYEADLDWSALSEPAELAEVLEQLGRATAKVHCVSDADDATTPLVDFQVEDAVAQVVAGRTDELVLMLTSFALDYAAIVRRDHALFVEAFRAGRIEGVGPVRSISVSDL
ncbi:MAG: DUF2252 domain-containing protein [Frankiales bacterium]|nr:DUF2252 domain-containing protein [Frankiales bacterium]